LLLLALVPAGRHPSPGWKVIALGVITTDGYLAVASILLPNQPNSWGLTGGATRTMAVLDR